MNRLAAALTTLLLSVGMLLVTVPTAPSAGAVGLNLHRGSRGVAVKVLEQRLRILRLLPARSVDRYYGPATTRAVKRFQRAHRLRMTGRVNARTWAAVGRAASVATPAAVPLGPAPRVVAHRGARVPAVPENSLASLRYATGSADVLEFDVRLTADGRPVLLHDATLDRTTGCTGPVAARALADLADCRLSDGSAIPTLEQVVGYAAQVGLPIAPELKAEDMTQDDLTRFVDVLTASGMSARTYVQSFLPGYFAPLHALDPSLRFVYLTGRTPVTADAVRAAGATVVGPALGTFGAAQVSGWHGAGLEVWPFTATSTQTLRSVWAMGVDAVFTDIPRDARALYGTPR